MSKSYHTIGEVAELFGLPTWKIRRAVDCLSCEIPRAGCYRLVPKSAFRELREELASRGWLASSPEAAS